ncbi:MAG: cysteine--tRNA ligase [Spirochaetaceae bacterium]|jgi:cysteinyl-tRNA synthetase|nr:cysteine--tRNA ligase [Spirochaetaceae bacterium]
MPLSLYNTLGRRIETFIPVHEGKVGFYGCGPTVYNYAHIGNLRAYVTHDTLVRVLRRFGYKVTHVMNVTDVGHLSGDDDTGDDKMLKSAEERGKTVLEVADFYTEAFFNDTDRLRIQRPDIVCKATEHIDCMIDLIKRIEAGGFTYNAGGNLYFNVANFPYYGELSGHLFDEQKTVSRTEIDGNKRNQSDFVLWFTKSKFENQALTWDSPWGRGYPGWHIECSAMSMKYLGEQFDIHAGGIDHIQIHHTNEIAQSEAATGKHPWVKYWVHNEFLVLDKEKMSKSAGSFITLQNLIDKGFDPLDYRYFLLGGHYRNQMKFSVESLKSAQNARKSLLSTLRSLAVKAGISEYTERLDRKITSKAKDHLDAFDAALEEDLNTPRALSSLWALVKDGGVEPKDALAAAFDMDKAIGLDLAAETFKKFAAVNAVSEAEIDALIAERAAAKAEKNFLRADEIRGALNKRGVILEDSPKGTTWRYG